jgi:hypothetical protein
MTDRIIGTFLIIIGLAIAGFGGTMSTISETVFYIVGMLTALVGGGFFVKYYKRSSKENREES